MAQNHRVSTLQQVLAVAQNHQPHEASITLTNNTSLRAADNLEHLVHAGTLGYHLTNADMLDCKVRCKKSVQAGYEEMIRITIAAVLQQIEDANVCINRLNNLLLIPREQLPFRGTAMVDRGKGVRRSIYPDNADQPENPFVDYDLGPQVTHHDDADPLTQERARRRDISSQRSMWKINLKAQQERKQVLTEFAFAAQNKLTNLMHETLDAATNAGSASGHADFRFLVTPNQPFAQP